MSFLFFAKVNTNHIPPTMTMSSTSEEASNTIASLVTVSGLWGENIEGDLCSDQPYEIFLNSLSVKELFPCNTKTLSLLYYIASKRLLWFENKGYVILLDALANANSWNLRKGNCFLASLRRLPLFDIYITENFYKFKRIKSTVG